MEQKAPSFVTLAKTMIAALEEQEATISELQRNAKVQNELNTAFDARIRRIEQELLSPKKEKEQKPAEEGKGKQTDRYESLANTLEQMYGPATHTGPEGLLWFLGRR